jgi:hypothetical protein
VVSIESRLFAGPDQYPPTDFAAYGIIAFPSRATPDDRDRYKMLCEVYLAALPHARELQIPDSQQMVMVWPMSENSLAEGLNETRRKNFVCDSAVDNYGLVVATRALDDARRARAENLDGRGPFLLAWSPATQKGQRDALVLVANLSNVTTSAEAQDRLRSWKLDILDNPDIWKPRWNLERVRITIGKWADRFGLRVLTIFGIN